MQTLGWNVSMFLSQKMSYKLQDYGIFFIVNTKYTEETKPYILNSAWEAHSHAKFRPEKTKTLLQPSSYTCCAILNNQDINNWRLNICIKAGSECRKDGLTPTCWKEYQLQGKFIKLIKIQASITIKI